MTDVPEVSTNPLPVLQFSGKNILEMLVLFHISKLIYLIIIFMH
jgi:hypothetical protein